MHQKLTNARAGARPLPWGDRWDAAATVVVLTQLVLVSWLIVPGGLYIDDVRAQAYAVDRPIWPFIVESNRTHLSPGARSVDWLQATYWPLEHWPAVVVTLVTSALLGLVLWRLLRLLLPDRPGIATTALALALFSASLVPSLAWYRQTLTTLVALVAMLTAVEVSVRFFRGASWRWAVVAVLLHPLALAFSERAIVLPVVVAVTGLALGSAPTWQRRVRRTAAAALPMAAVNVLFLSAYGSGDFDKGTEGRPTVTGFVLSTARSLFVNTIPSLTGGPILWRPAEPAYAYADTPPALVVASCTLAILLVAAAWRSRGPARRLAWRVSLVALAYIAPLYVILYLGRVSRAAINSVDDLRLYPDVAVFTIIALATVAAAATGPERAGAGSRRHRMVLVTGAATVAGLSLVSWLGFAQRWHTSPTADYLATLRTDLADRDGMLVPSTVPPDVIPGWVQPDFLTGSLARLLSPQTELTKADETRWMADGTGALVPAELKNVATAARATEDFCGNALRPGEPQLRIPFTAPVPYFRGSLLFMRVLASDTTGLEIAVTGDDGTETVARTFTKPELYRGPHTLLVPLPYDVRVREVTIRSTSESAGVCIPGLSVVLPGGRP